MTQPRKMTDHQKAAHLVLPMVVAVIRELSDEAEKVEAEAKRTKRSHDADSDWQEFAVKARARVDGATRVAALLQRLARG